MDFDKVFNSFFDDIANSTQILTEDSVRYILFCNMFKQDNDLNNYILELPYDKKYKIFDNTDLDLLSEDGRKELDLLYIDNNNKMYYAIEIKFHRPSPSESDKTNRAGKIFNDLGRLDIIKGKNIKKFFVYVTDDEMHKYFLSYPRGIKNTSLNSFFKKWYNPINEFIDTSDVNRFSTSSRDGSDTFFNNANSSFKNKYFSMNSFKINLKLFYSSDSKSNCPSFNRGNAGEIHLRIYEIK